VTRSRQILLSGGIALAFLGMSFGLWYAVFAEHQALDGIGRSLTESFSAAANRDMPQAQQAMEQYREAKYRYDRNVDAHGHWIGLAMVLILLAVGFDYVSFTEKQKRVLAWALLLGSSLFPAAVFLESFTHGMWPKILAALASGLVIAAFTLTLAGLLRGKAAANA
jgi:hypothetical protein